MPCLKRRARIATGRRAMARIEVEISNTQGHLRVDPARSPELVRQVLAAEGR